MNGYINIENVCKHFPGTKAENGTIVVLNGFSLSVNEGEFVTFFGPNGCGKTTLLNIVAGLLPPESGTVLIAGRPPSRATIGFVFQNYQSSLLPWRTNLDNVALPLELRGMNTKKRLGKTENFLQALEIEIPAYGYPYQLSGGQQQLLSIARALVGDPDVLLMDEPFNQLDFQTRIGMSERIQRIWMKTGKTILFVSHDLDEAVLLADRVILLAKRPTRVLKILENKLPRPRSSNVMQNEDYFRLRCEALDIFDKALTE